MKLKGTLTLIFLLLSSAPFCFGQSFSIGLKGGVRATNDLEQTWVAATKSSWYVIGPMVEFGLPSGFALEFDVLFSRQGYESAYGTALYDTTTRERANSWEVPILLRYRSRMQRVRPFIEAGYSVRLIHDSAEVEGAYSDGSGGYTSSLDHTKTDYTSQGFVAGGGVQFGVGRLQFAPEARYTHWNNRPVSQAYPDGPVFQSTQDQLQILVGVVFKLARKSH